MSIAIRCRNRPSCVIVFKDDNVCLMLVCDKLNILRFSNICIAYKI